MKAAIVYESMFGNTQSIAEAIRDGLAGSGTMEVAVMPLAEATPGTLGDVDLLVVGAPTHIGRMTTRKTREMGLDAAGRPPKAGTAPFEVAPSVSGPGVREWLNGLPKGRRLTRAAAFDTRLSYPLAGGAARSIARGLRRHGYQVDKRPQGFIVKAAQGPLRDGESERAKAWGAALVH